MVETMLMNKKLNPISICISKNLAMTFLLAVFIYIIFKPSELIHFNIYLPVYFAGLFAGAVIIYRMWKGGAPNALWAILGICLSLTLIALFVMAYDGFVDRRTILTWPAWFFVMCLGIFLSAKATNYHLRLSQTFKIVLLIQLCISIIQLFEPDAFSLLWSSEKTWGLNQIVRVTGSMYNPNFFAYIVAFLAAGIVAYKDPKTEYVWIFLSYSLIILSGSRTMILGFPMIIAFWYYLESRSELGKALKGAALSLISLYLIAALALIIFQDYLKYSAQLLLVVDSATGIETIRSYQSRLVIWHASFTELLNRDLMQLLLGKSNGYSYRPHQGFIYILAQFGILGLFLYCGLMLIILSTAFKMRIFFEGKFLYLTCLIVIGSSLTSVFPVIMTIGITLALVTGLAIQRQWSLLDPNAVKKDIT